MSNKNFLPALSDVELKENFSNIKPQMTKSEAIVEASRCLFCNLTVITDMPLYYQKQDILQFIYTVTLISGRVFML